MSIIKYITITDYFPFNDDQGTYTFSMEEIGYAYFLESNIYSEGSRGFSSLNCKLNILVQGKDGKIISYRKLLESEDERDREIGLLISCLRNTNIPE